MKNEEFSYVVEKHIAVLSRTENTTRELNLISYGGHPAKYDIRSWKRVDGKVVLYKGVTLSTDEVRALKLALNGIEEL